MHRVSLGMSLLQLRQFQITTLFTQARYSFMKGPQTGSLTGGIASPRSYFWCLQNQKMPVWQPSSVVLQPSGSVTVSQAFTSTVNVTWVPGHVTLTIFNVTVSDERTFTCRLSVPGNSWRSNIIVDVVGNLTVY